MTSPDSRMGFSPLPAKTILVVDDDEQVRKFIGKIVTNSGLALIETDTAANALSLATTTHVDGFVLDVNLGDGNGIVLCRQLRTLDAHRKSPIIMLTGSEEVSIAEAAFEAGCDDFVAKPVVPSLLRARLKIHLERVSHLKELETMRSLLGQYVSPRMRQVLSKSLMSGGTVLPEKQNVVICFTDVRDFTSLSEEFELDLLFSILSAHMATQEELIYQYGGYVDKFGGDGIMAIFDGDDMARRSCMCALAILDRAQDSADPLIRRIWRVGIGLHTGRVILGNFGSAAHLDYTVIGKPVNIAARLCGYASPMSVIVSDDLRRLVSDTTGLHFHSHSSANIRGLKEPMTIFGLSRAL
jgi:adenylate cyclase